jgi:hypothetical protein
LQIQYTLNPGIRRVAIDPVIAWAIAKHLDPQPMANAARHPSSPTETPRDHRWCDLTAIEISRHLAG